MVDVTAASGSAADIQDAVDTVDAGGGGTVTVPAGTANWNGETVTIPDGVNVIGWNDAGCQGHNSSWATNTAQTILHNNGDPRTMGEMFNISETTDTRISGIQFEATGPGTTTNEDWIANNNDHAAAIILDRCANFRVDHCTFINFCMTAVVNTLYWNVGDSAYGLMDHCYIYNPYKLVGSGWLWAYGVYSIGSMDYGKGAWDSTLSHFVGQYQAVANCAMMYMEDCRFNYCRHCTDGIQGAWNVVRYSLCEHNYPEYGSIDLHGPTGVGGWYGGRGMEAIYNTVNGVTGADGNNAGIRLRGGAGFFYENTINGADADSYGIQLDDYDGVIPDACAIHNTYIWSNHTSNCIALDVLQGTEDVDYFLRAPTVPDDGFVYVPYTYPHPLVGTPPPAISIPVINYIYRRMRT